MSVATVSQNAFVDAANSSTTALGAAGTFTGRAEDVSVYAAVNVFAFTDQAGTLFVEFSVDGQNWDKSNSYVVSASTANSQSLAPPAQFVRVRYVNGATPQTSFRLQTFYQPISPAAASTAMGTVTANQGTAGALAGGWPVKITDGTSILGTGAAPVRVDPTGTTTQPVSAASLPLPTGAATAANQTTLGSQTTKINDGTTTVAVTLANALKIDGSAVTQPVSAASLPLPAGAATEATLATRLADATFTARINTLGQKAMVASTPIVIASDQSAVPVSGTVTANIGTSGALALDATLTSGTQKTKITDGINDATVTVANALKVDGSAVTQPISAAALPLPAGAATEATLATRLADATFTGRINTLGQKTMAASTPIVIASDQSAVPISAASLPLPTGAATEATLATRASDRTTAAAPFSNRLSDGAAFYDATKTGQLPAALSGGRLDVVVGAALPTGTNNIGDVDVLTVPAPLSTAGGGTEATALRVTVASDSTGLLSVDDNGASLTVDSPQLPAALVGGRLDTNVGAWLGSTAPTVGQKTAANSLPTILASDQGALPVNVVGAHANAWSAAAVAAGGNSASIDCQYTPHISAFGTSNGNTTISLQVSQNDTDFYTAATVVVGGGGGDFALNLTIGARYIRLQSSAARTITASITGKD